MSHLVSSLRFLQAQPDARLIELARAGDERAFEALVRRYSRELMAFSRRLVQSESGAEDVLQQALLQAWVAVQHDVEIHDVRSWLYRIVHNVAVSDFRRAAAAAVAPAATEGSEGADCEAERRLAAREALAGLAALPELQRQVMLSTSLEGRSHDEIAAALGLSQGAVRGLIYRARAALRAAAALVTVPVVTWTSRQDVRGGGGSSRFAETLLGTGSAGGIVVKGTAIVAAAGVIAGATDLNPSHGVRPERPSQPARTLRAGNRPTAPGPGAAAASLSASRNSAGSAEFVADGASAKVVRVVSSRSSPMAAGPDRADRPSSSARATARERHPDRIGGDGSGRVDGGSRSASSGGTRPPSAGLQSGTSGASPESNGSVPSGSGSQGSDGQAGDGRNGSSTQPQNDGNASGSTEGGGPDTAGGRTSDEHRSGGQDAGSTAADNQGSSDSGASGGSGGDGFARGQSAYTSYGSDSGASGAGSDSSGNGASGISSSSSSSDTGADGGSSGSGTTSGATTSGATTGGADSHTGGAGNPSLGNSTSGAGDGSSNDSASGAGDGSSGSGTSGTDTGVADSQTGAATTSTSSSATTASGTTSGGGGGTD
jgi:RNA polymerase sigma factor (sigma-70 family)